GAVARDGPHAHSTGNRGSGPAPPGRATQSPQPARSGADRLAMSINCASTDHIARPPRRRPGAADSVLDEGRRAAHLAEPAAGDRAGERSAYLALPAASRRGRSGCGYGRRAAGLDGALPEVAGRAV